MATFQYLDEGNSEAQDRLAMSFFLAQTSRGLATTGVLSGLAVTQTATASGAVLVASGAAPVQASVSTGVALLVNDTPATLDVFTANPMGGLPRNDIVAFDSITKAIIAIIGTPNASPTDPTVPTTACALARLRHAAAAATIPTAKIDDLRSMTTLVGVTLVRGELSYVVGVTTGAKTTSAVIADRGVTDAATDYARVVEVTGIVNTSGIVAGGVWHATVTSSGSNVTVNVVGSARFPFVTSAAVGGSAVVTGSFDLAAGSTCNPKLWVELIAAGQITVSASSFRYRIRPAL